MEKVLDKYHKIRVGVFRGGTGKESELSIRTGSAVMQNMKDLYEIVDILVSKDGSWSVDGIPRELDKVLMDIDVAINAIHGDYGEDGKLQTILREYGIPYTGSHPLQSLMSLNKKIAKDVFRAEGIRTPASRIINKTEDIEGLAMDIFRNFAMPVILKPISEGSSNGILVAKDIVSLARSLVLVFRNYNTVLVEEFIEGKQVSCGVINDFRDKELYSLMPVEFNLKDSDYLDYTTKNFEMTCPAKFSEIDKKEIAEMAKKAHKVLDLRHYSKSDFIISPRRGIYLLETNALPDLSDDSSFRKALDEAGIKLSHFLDHILILALSEK